MKKILLLCLVSLSLFALTGCSDDAKAAYQAELQKIETRQAELKEARASRLAPKPYNASQKALKSAEISAKAADFTSAKTALSTYYAESDEALRVARQVAERREAERREALEAARRKQQAEKVTAVQTQSHTVRRGQTLWSIARKELGNPRRWPEIYEQNKDQIKDPSLIYPNQTFDIPAE